MAKEFIKVPFEKFDYSAFKMINLDWLQITAMADDKVNTMTASWGGIGEMWGKYCAFIFIRPQRFTKTLVDRSQSLTLQVLPETMRDTMRYFGTKSGADEDKIANSKVTVVKDGSHVYFEESDVVLKCTKLFSQELDLKKAMDNPVVGKWYGNRDFHTMYIVAIDSVEVSKQWLENHKNIVL